MEVFIYWSNLRASHRNVPHIMRLCAENASRCLIGFSVGVTHQSPLAMYQSGKKRKKEREKSRSLLVNKLFERLFSSKILKAIALKPPLFTRTSMFVLRAAGIFAAASVGKVPHTHLGSLS